MKARPRHRRRDTGVRASRRRYQARQRAARAERAAQLYALPPGHYTRAEAWQLYNRLAPSYSLPPLATANSFASRCQQVPAIIPHRRPRYYGGHCYTEEHVRTLLESTAAGHARRQLGWGRSLPTTPHRADARHMPAAAALEFYNSLAPAAGVRTLSDPLYLTRLLLRFNITPSRIVGHSFYWSRTAIRTAIRHSAAHARARGRAISRAHLRRHRLAAAAAERSLHTHRRAEHTTAKREDAARRKAERAAAATAKREETARRKAERAAAATAKREETARRKAERAAAATAKREETARRKAERAAAAAAKRRAAARTREEKLATARRYPVATAALLASGKLLTPSQFAALAHCSPSYLHHLIGMGELLAYHHPQRLRPILIHAPHAAAVLLERAHHHQP